LRWRPSRRTLRRIPNVEREPIRQILDGIAVEIDLEFVHTFGMPSRYRDASRSRRADVDDEDGAGLATEHVEVGDVESNVLTSERRIEMV
jgi:hypothetical protein